MKRALAAIGVILLAFAGTTFAGGTDLSMKYDKGLKMSSADNAFSFKIGGRIMNDWAFFSADKEIEEIAGRMEDGNEFRRARLYISGVLYERIEFKAQYDFAGGEVDFKDVFLGMKNVIGKAGVRVGHFKEPFSLEELTSSNYITFMERSLPVEAFSPSRNTGFMLHQASNRLSWGFGIFKDADSFGDASDNVDQSKWAITGRIAGTPWYDKESNKLLHLGFGYTTRDSIDDEVRFRVRPEMHLSPKRFVDTGHIAADGYDVMNAEIALVTGPFSAQAEYFVNSVDTLEGDSADFTGYYTAVSFFITGESRPYKKGSFNRVKPNQNFTASGGMGAWEIALRFSSLDLEDSMIFGGEEENLTLGINWYLNPNSRIMWNYVTADVTGVGSIDSFMMRLQVNF